VLSVVHNSSIHHLFDRLIPIGMSHGSIQRRREKIVTV